MKDRIIIEEYPRQIKTKESIGFNPIIHTQADEIRLSKSKKIKKEEDE